MSFVGWCTVWKIHGPCMSGLYCNYFRVFFSHAGKEHIPRISLVGPYCICCQVLLLVSVPLVFLSIMDPPLCNFANRRGLSCGSIFTSSFSLGQKLSMTNPVFKLTPKYKELKHPWWKLCHLPRIILLSIWLEASEK